MTMSSKKNILIISTVNGGPWGGSEPFWFVMALSLINQGHKITVAWFDWPERQQRNETLTAAGCQVIKLPNHRFASNKLQSLVCKWKAASILKKTLTDEQHDVVIISQGGYSDVTRAPFKALRPALDRYFLVCHNYNLAKPASNKHAALLKQWMDGAVLNLGDSQRIFSNMPAMAGFEVSNSAVILNPIGFEPAVSPEAWPPLQNENFIFMMFARLNFSSKAQNILVQTLAQDKWKAKNWTLWLYGDGPDRAALEALIQSTGLQHKVLLKGHTDDVRSALSQGHVLLQLTHLDAMPISVVEAMSMARPCVVTRVGDMPDWISDDFNGFVTDSATVAAIDTVLEKAWQTRENWQEMGQNAFSTFKQKYPVPYEEFYTRLLLGDNSTLPQRLETTE